MAEAPDYQWTQVTGKPGFAARDGAGALVFQNQMWLLGGGTYDTPQRPEREYFDEVWSTPDGIQWKRHADAPWVPRRAASVFVFGDALWMVAGNNMQSDV